jgi:hypothetical protein
MFEPINRFNSPAPRTFLTRAFDMSPVIDIYRKIRDFYAALSRARAIRCSISTTAISTSWTSTIASSRRSAGTATDRWRSSA